MREGNMSDEKAVTAPVEAKAMTAPAETTSAAQVDDPHDELSVLNQRIDDLIAGQKQSTSWYRNPSFITSVAAIFISVMTTAMSWYRTYQQDITALKTQLANTLQQTSAIQMQNVELMSKYKDDHTSYHRLSVALNGQNLILAKQAYSLARSLGSATPAVNLTTIANALLQSQEISLAEDLFRQAVERAENSVEYVQALRGLGGLLYYYGQRSEAEAAFNKALGAYKIYPKEAKSQDYINFTHAFTQFQWAQAVYSTDCRAAKDHLAQALQHMAQLSPTAQQNVGSQVIEFNRVGQLMTACQ
jgi:tetratricopeptide (TPR) repeat protein